MTISGEIFSEKGLHILHLNNSSLVSKIIGKKSNVYITGVSESRLYSSILNSELVIKDYLIQNGPLMEERHSSILC